MCLFFDGTYLTHHFWPLAPDRTLWEVKTYFPDARNAAQRFSQEYSKVLLREALLEDASTLEATQSMLASGAKKRIRAPRPGTLGPARTQSHRGYSRFLPGRGINAGGVILTEKPEHVLDSGFTTSCVSRPGSRSTNMDIGPWNRKTNPGRQWNECNTKRNSGKRQRLGQRL